MATGTVKWFSDAKGFGFIEPDEPGSDVFAHFSAIEMEGFKTLKQGSRVRYELQDGPKGPHAHHIVAENGVLIEPLPIAKITTSDALDVQVPIVAPTSLQPLEQPAGVSALS